MTKRIYSSGRWVLHHISNGHIASAGVAGAARRVAQGTGDAWRRMERFRRLTVFDTPRFACRAAGTSPWCRCLSTGRPAPAPCEARPAPAHAGTHLALRAAHARAGESRVRPRGALPRGLPAQKTDSPQPARDLPRARAAGKASRCPSLRTAPSTQRLERWRRRGAATCLMCEWRGRAPRRAAFRGLQAGARAAHVALPCRPMHVPA